VNVKKRGPFINTQHVTKNPEVTKSGEIPKDPENSKWGTISMFEPSVKQRFCVRIDRSTTNHWNSCRILQQIDQETFSTVEFARFGGSFVVPCFSIVLETRELQPSMNCELDHLCCRG
jgi:hypothetical protein